MLWVIDRAWLNDKLRLKVSVRDTGMIWIEASMRVGNRTVNDAKAWIHNFWHKARVYNRIWFDDNLWLDRTDLRIVRARLNDA